MESATVPVESTVGIEGTYGYSYDAFGRRISFSNGGNQIVYVISRWQVVSEHAASEPSGTATDIYIYGSYVDEPILRSAQSESTLNYYHRDQHHSITALTDGNGNVVERYAYTGYGHPAFLDGSGVPFAVQTSAQSNRYAYTGREYDETLGLYYFRNRILDPASGRFCSRDPIGYGGGNHLYLYVQSNPLSLLDPLGLDWLDNSANFAAGAADSLTMGVHGYVRGWLGINDGIDVEGGWYFAGEMTEIAVETTVTLGAGASRHVARRSARYALEAGARTAYRRKHKIVGGIIHHATPIKGHIGGVPSYFPLPYKWAARGSWNMQYVANVAEHAAMHRRLRQQERMLRLFQWSQPVRNGGNLIIQHVLDEGPYLSKPSTPLPEVTMSVEFSGTRTLFYEPECDPNPSPFAFFARGTVLQTGTDVFQIR